MCLVLPIFKQITLLYQESFLNGVYFVQVYKTDTFKCNTEKCRLSSLLISMVWSDAFTQFNQQQETETRNTWILVLAGQMKIVHLFLI